MLHCAHRRARKILDYDLRECSRRCIQCVRLLSSAQPTTLTPPPCAHIVAPHLTAGRRSVRIAIVLSDVSRTFSEFLLLPNLTPRECTPHSVDLATPLCRFTRDSVPELRLNVPMTSSIMQSVSNDRMAVALARSGGLSFVFASQPVAAQAAMVQRVKKYKAGFVASDTNLPADATLQDVISVSHRTGHTTIAITEDGNADGRLLGILTGRDYRLGHVDPSERVSKVMTPFESLVYAEDGITLKDANALIWQHKINTLPVVAADRSLLHLVFRKDYEDHKENPDELVDDEKRLLVGAGINTFDYRERVPALVEAGADVLCIDSSDGYSEFQEDCLAFVRNAYGDSVKVGGGNVVDGEGFAYLADAGADFVKVGVGPGSICITREQKGIGRGQASAVLDVAAARDERFERTGEYVPICSDGGIFHDYHITLALAMGADFVMMGRYFARFDESPAPRIRMGGNFVKEYWGEGTTRANNWERYDGAGGPRSLSGELGVNGSNGVGRARSGGLLFEEGVDGYVPYAGKLKDNLTQTLAKIRATMCNCGVSSIAQFHRNARLTVVSATSLREGGIHDVAVKDGDMVPGL